MPDRLNLLDLALIGVPTVVSLVMVCNGFWIVGLFFIIVAIAVTTITMSESTEP